MKHTILFFLLLVLINVSDAMASGVYKCEGADGSVTFSFTPCVVVLATTTTETLPDAEQTAAEEPTVSRRDQLRRLNADIEHLQQVLEDTRQQYEITLRTGDGRRRMNELSAEYDATSSDLIAQINVLQAQRDELY